MTSKPKSGGTAGQRQTNGLAPGLYIVATPIGNSRDITLRALDVLAGADVIACEDTRTSRKLLSIHGIKTPCTAYHDHNAQRVRPALLRRLRDGGRVALVSDAGTPLISDPGYKLVRAAAETDIAVWPIPGASSVLAALMTAGLPTDRFLFAGFLPSKAGARRKALEDLKATGVTLVLFESTRRLPAALADMADILGPREAVVGRELTKLFEEVRRGGLRQLADHFAAAGAPKGEVVIAIGPPDHGRSAPADLDRVLGRALQDLSVKTASSLIADLTGVPRREIYARALELDKEGRDLEPR